MVCVPHCDFPAELFLVLIEQGKLSNLKNEIDIIDHLKKRGPLIDELFELLQKSDKHIEKALLFKELGENLYLRCLYQVMRSYFATNDLAALRPLFRCPIAERYFFAAARMRLKKEENVESAIQLVLHLPTSCLDDTFFAIVLPIVEIRSIVLSLFTSTTFKFTSDLLQNILTDDILIQLSNLTLSPTILSYFKNRPTGCKKFDIEVIFQKTFPSEHHIIERSIDSFLAHSDDARCMKYFAKFMLLEYPTDAASKIAEMVIKRPSFPPQALFMFVFQVRLHPADFGMKSYSGTLSRTEFREIEWNGRKKTILVRENENLAPRLAYLFGTEEGRLEGNRFIAKKGQVDFIKRYFPLAILSQMGFLEFLLKKPQGLFDEDQEGILQMLLSFMPLPTLDQATVYQKIRTSNAQIELLFYMKLYEGCDPWFQTLLHNSSIEIAAAACSILLRGGHAIDQSVWEPFLQSDDPSIVAIGFRAAKGMVPMNAHLLRCLSISQDNRIIPLLQENEEAFMTLYTSPFLTDFMYEMLFALHERGSIKFLIYRYDKRFLDTILELDSLDRRAIPVAVLCQHGIDCYIDYCQKHHHFLEYSLMNYHTQPAENPIGYPFSIGSLFNTGILMVLSSINMLINILPAFFCDQNAASNLYFLRHTEINVPLLHPLPIDTDTFVTEFVDLFPPAIKELFTTGNHQNSVIWSNSQIADAMDMPEILVTKSTVFLTGYTFVGAAIKNRALFNRDNEWFYFSHETIVSVPNCTKIDLGVYELFVYVKTVVPLKEMEICQSICLPLLVSESAPQMLKREFAAFVKTMSFYDELNYTLSLAVQRPALFDEMLKHLLTRKDRPGHTDVLITIQLSFLDLITSKDTFAKLETLVLSLPEHVYKHYLAGVIFQVYDMALMNPFLLPFITRTFRAVYSPVTIIMQLISTQLANNQDWTNQNLDYTDVWKLLLTVSPNNGIKHDLRKMSHLLLQMDAGREFLQQLIA